MELVIALRTDLRASFPALVEAYQDALYRFALRLTANSHDAEEIAQEAFVRAYRWLQANALPDESKLRPWLYQVTLNVFRNRRRRRQLAVANLADAHNVPGNGAVEPARRSEQEETRAELAAALARLPERYREAIVLRHVEQLSYPDMAAALKRPEGSIKSDVHRGLALLRAALAGRREEILV